MKTRNDSLATKPARRTAASGLLDAAQDFFNTEGGFVRGGVWKKIAEGRGLLQRRRFSYLTFEFPAQA